jgi:hypothetical protein
MTTISIAMATYNGARFIREQLDSLAAQTYLPSELVVTDDGSSDKICLLGDREIVFTVDHRFALSNPALVSPSSKKSFSSVNSPILAWSDFTSTVGVAGVPPPDPKTSEEPPSP